MPPVLFIDMWPDRHPRGVFRERFADVPVAASASGAVVEVVHHGEIDPGAWSARPPAAIMLSGSSFNLVDDPDEDREDGTSLARFEPVARLLAALPDVPTLGICFGHQYLARAGGGRLARMPARRGENDFPIQPTEAHPLLAGLPASPCFVESHAWRVELPAPGYRVVATSVDGIEMVAHATLPRVGVQFHPEYFRRQDPARAHGRGFLANWFGSIRAASSQPR